MQTLKKIKTKCLLRIVVEVGNERWALGFLRQGKYCVCVCVCAHACTIMSAGCLEISNIIIQRRAEPLLFLLV